MAIDFTIPEDAREVRERVRRWVQEECLPAEREMTAGRPFKEVLAELRTKARAQGLWCPFIPEEHGGMGLGPLANALVQMELGQSHLGALSMNSQGPDDATMLTLLAHGTDFQKEKYLKPLLNGEKRICYSMTEKAAGADATGMQTRAEKDGKGNYILNGEKWFSSAASAADIAVIMAKTNPDAPRHQQFSTFIVELPNPGYRIVRDIPTMAVHGPHYVEMGGGHAEVKIENLVVPEENLLPNAKGLSGPFGCLNKARFGISWGALGAAEFCWHAARQYSLDREQFGRPLAANQLIQKKLADMQTDISLGLQGCLQAGRMMDNDVCPTELISLLKRNNCSKALEIARTARNMHGGNGISDEFHVIRHAMNLEAVNTYEGTHDIHALIIGRQITGLQAFF